MKPHERIIERLSDVVTRQHGDRADISAIASCDPWLINAYDSKVRVRVENTKWGDVRTGTVSRSTGWRPCLLLIARSNQVGSSDVLGPDDRVTAFWNGRKYVEVSR